MHHAKWNFNVLFSSVGLVAIVLIFSGCQNSDDDYQVITEEMSQPVAEGTSLAESDTENSSPVPNAEVIISETNDVPDSATPKEEPESVTAVVPVKPAQGTEQLAQPDKEPATETTVAEVTPLPDGTSETQEPENKVSGFINLQEEIDRQKRMQKLGLGQNSEPSEPREIKLLVKDREFPKESATDAWRVSYNDLDLLKILNMEPVPLNAQDYLPEWLTALEGKKVILRGWMFPPLQPDGLKGFIFVRDNQVCCFGPNAKAYDKLTVRLKKGNTTSYIQGRPFDVVGTFKLDSWIEDERDMRTGKFIEKLGMLYHIEDAVVIDQ